MKRAIVGLALASVTLASTPADATQFRHPSSCHSGCMVVTAYYDYGGVKDWSCGSVTYGGHRGTDFAIYGRFSAMDAGRDIVAVADGDVVYTHDGEFDRCESGSCAGGGGFGNWVKLRHADGKETIYAHMRKGSVAVKVGDKVTCGQKLGLVGSSGYSTGPHLHFEPRVAGKADDPFGKGACSGPLSYWVEQGAYKALPAMKCEAVAPPPPPPNQPPKGSFDSLDCEKIRGWTQDPDDPTKATQVDVWIDGEAGASGATKLSATANLKRDDLCGPLGSCDHAFEIPFPATLRDGKPHTMFAYAIDLGGGPSTKLPGSPKTVTCSEPAEPTPSEDSGATEDSASTLDDAAIDDASSTAEPPSEIEADGALHGSCACRVRPIGAPGDVALVALVAFVAAAVRRRSS